VTEGWQTVLRAKNIYGPYEDRVVMDRGRTEVNGPHQGGWVELNSGESWFVHFQDRGAYGRIVHLQPMNWRDDWPVIGADPDGDGKGEPVATHRKPNVGRDYAVQSLQASDEFSGVRLGLQWQWHANPLDEWLSLSRPGWLSLSAMPWPGEGRTLWTVPNLLLQKLPAREFTVTTRVDATSLREGERSGLVMMGRDYSYIAVVRTATGVRLVRVTCLDAAKASSEREDAAVEIQTPSVYLRLSVVDDAVCEFSFGRDGKRFESSGKEFKAKPGVWIGAKVGLFALGPPDATTHGHADYDWFRFELKR
jgi:beta-xylosidase